MEHSEIPKPSGRTIEEVLKASREEFYKANGHYGTEEEAIRLTEEARAEIRKEKELTTAMITFKDIRPYISKIDRVSICNKDTLRYENYQFIDQIPAKYDNLYLYGIGRKQCEFPASQAPDAVVWMEKMGYEKPEDDELIYAECIEIMLSEEPREDV